MSAAGLSQHRLARLKPVLAAYVDRGEVAGIVALISRRGTVHVEALGAADLESGAPMRRDTIFRIASMTKPVTAVAAMMLVEEAKLRLDAPVDPFLPELADRRVLRDLAGPVSDTVPAARAITLRDLLTFRWGFGAIMARPGTYPIQQVIAEAGLSPGPFPSTLGPDAWMARLGALPLLHQPGERWMYHTGSDVLGVLVARASGMELGRCFQERIFDPLGMKDTGFYVPESALHRLATAYARDAASGQLRVIDKGPGGAWSRPPEFASGGGGLVSTADDVLAFGRMMLEMGRAPGGERLLSGPSVALMTSDHIDAAQKSASPFFSGFWEGNGWGFGVAVVTRRFGIADTPGRYGWAGGFGTSWCNDPAEDMTVIVLTQRMMTGPSDTVITDDVLTLAYQAIDDD